MAFNYFGCIFRSAYFPNTQTRSWSLKLKGAFACLTILRGSWLFVTIKSMSVALNLVTLAGQSQRINIVARSMFGTCEVGWPVTKFTWSQRAARTSTSKITPTGVYRKKQTNKQTRKKVIPQSNTLRKLNTVIYCRVTSEAIFGNRDRKRELFLAL